MEHRSGREPQRWNPSRLALGVAVALTLHATTALASKDEPAPATGAARPALVPRGTPTVSTLAADTASAAQEAADCEALVAAAKTKSEKKRAEMLAACKEARDGTVGSGDAGGIEALAITYDPSLDHCVNGTKTLCANPDVFHFIHAKFEVTSSNALSVYTTDLQSIAGSTPDTLLYLMKCSSSVCDAGEIVAINDDIGGWPPNYASSITLSVPSSGWYAVYVVAYSAGRRGLCDLVVSQTGGVNFTYSDHPFSLWSIGPKEVRPYDVLVVGKNPGADSMTTAGFANYHDSKVLLVSNAANNCTTDCGRFQFQDDTVIGTGATTYMTRLSVGTAFGTPTSAKIMVGVYGSGTVGSGEHFKMNARLAHMRWYATTGDNDIDGDRITAEVEAQLGTCDSGSDTNGADILVDGWDCADVREWVNTQVNAFEGGTICPTQNNPGTSSHPHCWSPSDSDHDGIDDGAEFFVLAVGCDGAPAGPYREATGCTQVRSLFDDCDSGDWCALEPASGNMNSPFFGQDPTVYDVFVEADYLRSTDQTIEADHQHALSAAQQAELGELWGVEPAKCWDGASTGTCQGPTDLRYRVNMHAFAGSGHQVVDDRAQEEIIKGGGATFVRSHFYARANAAMRAYRAHRYAIALHQDGNGQTDATRTLQWGNQNQTDFHARKALSHEVGHTLGVTKHYHDGQDPQATTCGTPPTACTWCTADGTNCSPALPNHDCPTTPTAVNAVVENPVVPTLMSYQYARAGMLPLNGIPPSTLTSYSECKFENLRFSKGLLGRQVDETNLDNSWSPGSGWAEWQLRHLAQSMFCYQSYNQCRGPGTFGLFDDYGNQYGPYCDVDSSGAATTCYFNWDGQTAWPTNTSTALGDTDITAGRWHVPSLVPGLISNTEILEDMDEWAKMLSGGRRILAHDGYRWMCLYANTFNGPQLTDDFCGWDETIVVDGGMTATEVNYPIEGCTTTATCAGANAVCLIEAGTCSPTACPSQACANGSCSCADVNGDDDDSLCLSGQCVAGRCVRTWGGCTCTSNTDCPGQGSAACVGAPNGRCKTFRDGEAAQPVGESGQPWPLRDSAEFDGNDDRLQLVGGSESRLASIGSNYQNRFSLHFDFRFDGFDGTESAQVLWSSNTFQLVVASADQVQATVGGHTALVWSGLERGRWYRVIWSASRFDEQGHFLWLRRMDPETGWYGAAGTGGGGSCVYQSWSTDLASPGDVWIGHDGSSDASLYFHGRIDNVALVNFTSARPIDCTEQQ